MLQAQRGGLTGVRIGGVVKPAVAGGAALLLLSVALPYFGWQGSRTIGPTVGLLGAAAVLAAVVLRRRWLAGAGAVLGVAAVALITWRLLTPATVPVAVQGLFGHARSTASLLAGLAGALVTSLAAIAAVVELGPSGADTARLGPERPSLLTADHRAALVAAWHATWTSRLLVWAAGVLAVLQSAPQTVNTGPSLARPFGHLGTVLTAPASAWDAGNYLTIARFGYGLGRYLDAFFPLYPTLIRLAGFSAQAALLMGIAISIAALAAALYLLYRLVALECGDETARLAVLLMAFFPMALFYSAVYTESLFLFLTVGAFYAGRREWWARAGIAGALAAAARVTGVLILFPLVVMYLFGPRGTLRPSGSGSVRWRSARYPLRGDFAFLLLIPLGVAGYLAYHGIHGDWLAPLHAERRYWHLTTAPLLGAIEGTRDFVRSILQIAGGPASQYLPAQPSNQLLTPFKLAAENITDFAFLVFGCVATVGAFRRLPAAYGVYAAISVAAIASNVSHYQPLASFPRYVAVVFPCQIWLALWAQRRESRRLIALAVSGGFLALFAGEFATWNWVA